MKLKRNNKGFTLVELLITIAVIAILVFLAAPRLLGYTDKAKMSEITTNTRSIQDAAERYYLDHDETEWPRLTDEPYTDDEVKAFAEKIYDITGEEVNLDPDGNYYDIDFEKLKPYIDVPGEKANYILQNPVGKVYLLYKPTTEALGRLNSLEEDLINGEDKYVPIANANELQKIAFNSNDLQIFGEGTKWEGKYVGNLSSNFIQVKDIDLYSIRNFIPIGNVSTKFTGVYNGGRYKIENLNINKTGSYIGLFGYAERSYIKNVFLENAEVEGGSHTGGLVGFNVHGTIDNTYSTGKIIGNDNYVGGLVGYNTGNESIIKNSYSEADVHSKEWFIGGLVGRNSAKIMNSYSVGFIDGGIYTGGLVGQSTGQDSLVINSYSMSNVISTGGGSGGLIGYLYQGEIINSYATGKVNGVREGGLTGDNSGHVYDSYFDKQTGLLISTSGKGLTTDEMKSLVNHNYYSNWDKSIWKIEPGYYPILINTPIKQ